MAQSWAGVGRFHLTEVDYGEEPFRIDHVHWSALEDLTSDGGEWIPVASMVRVRVVYRSGAKEDLQRIDGEGWTLAAAWTAEPGDLGFEYAGAHHWFDDDDSVDLRWFLDADDPVAVTLNRLWDEHFRSA